MLFRSTDEVASKRTSHSGLRQRPKEIILILTLERVD